MLCEEGYCSVVMRGIKTSTNFYFTAKLSLWLNPNQMVIFPVINISFSEVLLEYFCMLLSVAALFGKLAAKGRGSSE
jgi:hypothetical protein